MAEYTITPTIVRLYCDKGLDGIAFEWFIDGFDPEAGLYTEPCWSYDTFAEASANVDDFVRNTTEQGMLWDFKRSHSRR